MDIVLERWFLDRVDRADDMEEVGWLHQLYEAVEEHDWKNVSYRAWVISEKYGRKHNSLLWAIDREYGEEIRVATAESQPEGQP